MAAPNHPLLAAGCDWLMGSLEGVRRRMLADLGGDILEIGVGTGLNIPHYRDLRGLWAVEPDPHMRRRAERRAEAATFPIDLREAGAEALPFEDGRFDTAVITWVLCSVEAPERAMAEAYRVLRPGGRLVFAEHTRSRFPLARGLQSGFDPLWSRMAGGCHVTRDSIASIETAGFVDLRVEPVGREGWTLFPMYRGEARRP
jgi:ubiquinone/menaquinone biosynthesis C-methylase UbiE